MIIIKIGSISNSFYESNILYTELITVLHAGYFLSQLENNIAIFADNLS